MLDLETRYDVTSEIIGEKRTQAPTNLSLNKKIIVDTSNVRKMPTVATCVDATKCYDRVPHSFVIMRAKYFG